MISYSLYKPSSIDWIGDIPSHWNLATVGRVFNLGRGRVISAIEIGNNIGIYPVYSSQTENNGVMGYLNSFDFDGEYVTWTTDGANAGTVFYRKDKFNCTNVCGTIQPKKQEQIDLRFLPYFLNLGTRYSVRLDINPKLMNNMMAKIPFLIPPKEEQTAIANYLDGKTSQLNTLIANKQKLIELLKEERIAIINQAVTRGIYPNVKLKPSDIEWLGDIPQNWNVKKLKWVCSITDCKHLTPKYFAEGIPVVSTGNVKPFEISLDSARKVREEDFGQLSEGGRKPKLNDIIYSRNASVGAAALVRTDLIFCLGQDICLIRSNENQTFIENALNSNYVLTQLENVLVGSTFRRINIEKIKEFLLILPTIDEQHSIVSFIQKETNKVDTTISKIEKEIELLQEYRTALISEVVTGKIKVT